MYVQQFDTRHKLGLERLTGDNSGRVFANERTVTVEDAETGETSAKYEYDVYEVSDSSDPKAVKDAVISEAYPNGAEQKLLRQTMAKVLKAAEPAGLSPDIAEPVWRLLIDRCIAHEFGTWDQTRG